MCEEGIICWNTVEMFRAVAITIFGCLLSGVAVSGGPHMVQQSKSTTMEDVGSAKHYFGRPNMNSSDFTAIREMFVGIIDLCNSSFPTPFDTFLNMYENSGNPENITHNSKCYLRCMLTNIRLFDEMGNVNKTLVHEWFSRATGDDEFENKQLSIIENCMEEEGKAAEKVMKKDPCEVIYERVGCFVKGSLDQNTGTGKNRGGKGDKM